MEATKPPIRDRRMLKAGLARDSLEKIAGAGIDDPPIVRSHFMNLAAGVLMDLAQYWIKRQDDRTHEAFTDCIWTAVCEVIGPSGTYDHPDTVLSRLGLVNAPCDEDPDATLLLHGVLSCAYSMRALADGEIDWAMDDLLSASSYVGAIEGAHLQRIKLERQGGNRAALSSLGSIGAYARHAENRALKEDVFAWCDAHMEAFNGSMDDAALAIANKVVPIKFRTVRAHMTEWKKLRSAGKP